MNVTLTLDDELVKKVRKIAVDRDTTLTGLIRAHLQEIANEDSIGQSRALEALERTFDRFQFNVGERTWKREDLHDRPAMKRWE